MLDICFTAGEAGVLKLGLGKLDRSLVVLQEHWELGDDDRLPWLRMVYPDCCELELRGLHRKNKSAMRRILREAKAGGSLRLWFSESSEALCGYYHLISLLEGADCAVFSARLPVAADPRDVAAAKTVLLSDAELREIAESWRRQTMPLRFVRDGKIIGVPPDHFDGRDISSVLQEYSVPVGFLRSRKRYR